MTLQTLVQTVFPPECLSCSALVEAPFSICGACWSKTPFIFGAACTLCGIGLPGQTHAPGEQLICDACHEVPRPWEAGRAVMEYAYLGRHLVLGLKHADRSDIARAAGAWMARAGAEFWADDPILVPIPLHRLRLAKRRYNQAALLAHWIAKHTGGDVAPQALERVRNTGSQDGHDRDGRFRNVSGAMAPHRRFGTALAGRPVVLVDDVMTSGATYTAAAEACSAAGASSIRVLTLARVGKET